MTRANTLSLTRALFGPLGATDGSSADELPMDSGGRVDVDNASIDGEPIPTG